MRARLRWWGWGVTLACSLARSFACAHAHTHAQVQGPGQTAYRGVWSTLRQIWVTEGPLGYLKGNGTNVVRIAPYSAVQFAAYEKYKQVRRGDGAGRGEGAHARA